MKSKKHILLALLFLGGLFACTDNWDSHYNQEEQIVENNNIIIVNQTAVEYIKSQPELSLMYKLFNETGVIQKIEDKKLLYTILVVNDDEEHNIVTNDKTYLAESHISDISLSPSNLSDGQRILTWNGKYINVSKVKNEDKSYSIAFNGNKVKKITKVNDGYIYELEDYVNTPKSMYEVISSLSDDYSIFRDAVMSKNQLTFDKNASLPIGVDKTGSTVYDSVFIVTNPYFQAKDFDLFSESLNATMLIPSNEIATKALETAKNKLNDWGLEREDSILQNWIYQSVFFNQTLTKQDFLDNEDLSSIFDKQWRTTVQKINLDNPISLSNGIAYYVTEMVIPTNVLIYRIKDYMRWYEYLSEQDKEKYFTSDNLIFDKMETKVTEWSGWPEAGFPNIINRVLRYKLQDVDNQEFHLYFKGHKFNETTKEATTYLIPPGEYDLCL